MADFKAAHCEASFSSSGQNPAHKPSLCLHYLIPTRIQLQKVLPIFPNQDKVRKIPHSDPQIH